MTLRLRTASQSIAVALLLGCATTPRAAIELAPGTSTAMRPGEHALLPDRSRLDYVGVRSDSRCPPDVTCVHAGWAELDFVHRPVAGATRHLVLSTRTGAAPARAGAWHLELVTVGRGASPVAQVRASAHGN